MNDLKLQIEEAKRFARPYKHFLRTWAKPISRFGIGAGILAIYFIDWRVVTTKIPYYRQKFSEDKVE